MPKGGKEAFLSKVTFRRESNWYSNTKQMLKDMKTTEEIIQELLDEQHEMRWMDTSDLEVYLRKVAEAQKAIDHSEEHLAWIIKQYFTWTYETFRCDNNEQCTFKEWIDKKINEE